MSHAAIISLKHTVKRLNITHEEISNSLNLLEDIFPYFDGRRNSRSSSSVISALEAEIKEAAWKLEDVLESYALHHSLTPSKGLAHFPVHEKGIEQDINSFVLSANRLEALRTQLRKDEKERKERGAEEEDYDIDEGQENDDEDTASRNNFGGKKPLTIGFLDQFEIIMNEILDGTPGLRPFSIVGMAGIGKTHLAREIYQHHIIVRHFDLTLWLSVGKEDRIENAVVDIVAQLEISPCTFRNFSELMKRLQNGLNGRSYLIVLDDIWGTKVFNFLMKWLPPYGKERRLLLTTRLEHVDECHNTKTHRIRFMDNEESWNLLRQNVFGPEDYVPPQLEEVGKKIAENCEGLPLLILEIARILRGLEKTEEFWKKVANKKTTTFTDAYDKISKILYTSYEHLPNRLKPCFLYMGVFPQTSKIPTTKLINLWIVEDFIDPSHLEKLEDLCMKYLKELVSNSIVIVCKKSCSSDSRIKSSKLHSAYWYMCVKEARKDKLFHVLHKLTDAFEDCIEKQRRLSVQTSLLFSIEEVRDSIAATSPVRSLLCTGEDHQYPVPICYNLTLLRVLDADSIRLYDFPVEVVNLLLLRYLSLTHNGKLPASISQLRRLQCLVVRQHHNVKLLRDSRHKKWWEPHGLRYSTCLPKEIWDMQELKHVRIMGRNLPNPSFCKKLPRLSTLYVSDHSCTRSVFRSIPNLAKLGIEIELQPDAAEILNSFEYIYLLRRLQSLKCFVVNPRLKCGVVAPPHHLSHLPRCLKKLSLNGLGYSWKSMSAIGLLPNLEVLKLRCSAFQGPVWETAAGEFPSLEFLMLEDIDLVQWSIYNDESLPNRDHCFTSLELLTKRFRADDERCFRRLQHLVFRHCYRLKEIPLVIEDIPTLIGIEVVDCSPSAVASARRLKERNSSLEVEIISSWNRR